MPSHSKTAPETPAHARHPAGPVPQSGRLAYIDGVRAIAIIAVVAFHAQIPGFSGGFVGVDIFFVISGFLITQQIASQMLDGRFSAADFYARRILRIFPPLLLVTAVTVAIAPLFPLLPEEARNLAKSAAATAAMVSNYYFANGTEYFAVRAEVNPLLHTWSLGVEEQYYLFVPAAMAMVVALAAHRRWQPLPALLGGVALAIVASYAALAILTNTDHRLAFFSIMTRAWQFAAGGMLALCILQGVSIPARLRSVLGSIGFVAIAASVHWYQANVSYPGTWAGLLPTIGTVLLLASGLGHDISPLVRALGSRPAVAIGLVSYSWYLWHWPLTEFGRSLPIAPDSVWKDVAATSLALALSIPTYLLLERPMKRLRRNAITRAFGGRIVAGGLAGSALVAVLALALGRSPLLVRDLQAIDAGEPSTWYMTCAPNDGLPKFHNVKPCVLGDAADPSVVFWGDSHTLMLAPVAEWSARIEGRNAVVLGTTSCPPLLDVDVEFFVKRTCAANNDEILGWLKSPQARTVTGVVLAARWPYYSGNDTPGGDAERPRVVWRQHGRPESGYQDMLRAGLRDTLTALSPDRRVLIVGPVPEMRHVAADCLLRIQMTGQPRETCAMDRVAVEQRRRDTMQTLRQVAALFPNVHLIDPLDVFCDRSKCRPSGPSGVFYADNNHLDALGNETLYQHFRDDFRWVYENAPRREPPARVDR